MAWIREGRKVPAFYRLPSAGAWIEIIRLSCMSIIPSVAPSAGAWIEMSMEEPERSNYGVAPSAGAWIEIHQNGG